MSESIDVMTLKAPVEAIFDVLADGTAYAHWVVGAKAVRRVDQAWPAKGTCFYPTVGIGPFTIKDSTECLEVEAPRRIVLEARMRPLMVATVELQLEPVDEGTQVTMTERPSAGLVTPLGRLMVPALSLRNKLSLARLERLVQARVS